MKLAITDACIFIDLHDLDLTVTFFSLNFEIHTSLDVYNELYREQKNVLNAFLSVDKLHIHNIDAKSRLEIMATAYPLGLSEVDKTVLYLAQKYDALVLSSDKALRNFAKKLTIDYHGMLWIFEQMIAQEKMAKATAILKLTELISRNKIYQNNLKLRGEFQKRIEMWKH
jgi:predicted nucleic acid-binding protein